MAAKPIVFGLHDKPPFPIMVLSGLQHVLTLFGATTLIPLLVGPAMGMSPLQVAVFISYVYFGMGVATLIQTSPILGSGLPIVQGSSFSFVPAIITVAMAYQAEGPYVVMQHITGALIAGGLLLAFIGYSGLIGLVRRFITPVVIGPVIMAIGFSLAPVAIEQNAASYWPISLLVVGLIILFNLVIPNKYAKIFAILASIAIAYLLCVTLSVAGVFPAGHPANVDFSGVGATPWFRTSFLLPWGMPRFSLLAFGAMLAGFFAVMIESIGDYHSCCCAGGMEDPTPGQINRGIGAEGINCAIAGFFGSVGTTSYSENVGLIALTGVASRWVVRTGAVILIILSFFTKVGSVVVTMPTPVIGGAYIALFGLIGALGIQILMRADMGSQRNVLIVGFAFLMALGLPGWVENNQELFVPAGSSVLVESLGGMVWAIMKTPMAVAGICAGLLDNVVPGTLQERGMSAPPVTPPAAVGAADPCAAEVEQPSLHG